MDRLLALNLGNTNLHWGVFEGSTLSDAGRLPAAGPWELPLPAWRGAARAVFASVNRDGAARWLDSWGALGGIPIEQLGADNPLPIRCLGPDPRLVGADRLLNAIAWRERSNRPALIVDFGTAVTIDVVSPQGDFCGGVILPGPELLARSLASGTSLLPYVDIEPTEILYGRDTKDAIRRGVFGMLAGGIGFHIHAMKQRLARDTAVVATGGGAATYSSSCEGIEIVAPHLTLDGLRVAAAQSGGA
ncbi:MAG: type III pantothenate kinase [Planctomycetes bacterium]|nr:type III pantothenate kinase [Planctomycetota bacterium]